MPRAKAHGRAGTAELVESGSNHMGHEPAGVLLVEQLCVYLELRAGSEIGASGGGPGQDGRARGVLAAQAGDGQGSSRLRLRGRGTSLCLIRKYLDWELRPTRHWPKLPQAAA